MVRVGFDRLNEFLNDREALGFCFNDAAKQRGFAVKNEIGPWSVDLLVAKPRNNWMRLSGGDDVLNIGAMPSRAS